MTLMKNLSRMRTLLVVAVVVFVSAFLVALQAHGISFGIGVSTVDEVREYILCKIVVTMFGILMTVSVIMFIYAAYLYLTAADNAEKVSKAHRIFLWGSVAIVVAFVANSVPTILALTFGAGGIPLPC